MSSASERASRIRTPAPLPEDLLHALRAIELRRSTDRPCLTVDLGWQAPAVSPSLSTARAELTTPAAPRLWSGAIHEWFGDHAAPDHPSPLPHSAPDAPPPLGALAHAARRILLTERTRPHASTPRPLIWIGRTCRPSPLVLRDLLPHSIWIDPPDDNARLWCIDLALRCPGVAAVIADGRALDMAGSRRLQLAAEAGNTIGLLARPIRELKTLSAAATRWRVAPLPTSRKRPRWTVELLRCKGLRPADGSPRRFVVEWDHAQGSLALPPDLVHRPGSQARSHDLPTAIG